MTDSLDRLDQIDRVAGSDAVVVIDRREAVLETQCYDPARRGRVEEGAGQIRNAFRLLHDDHFGPQ